MVLIALATTQTITPDNQLEIHSLTPKCLIIEMQTEIQILKSTRTDKREIWNNKNAIWKDLKNMLGNCHLKKTVTINNYKSINQQIESLNTDKDMRAVTKNTRM